MRDVWPEFTLFSSSWFSEQSPPKSGWPQATTDSSAKIAAKAPPFVPRICCTFLSWSWTAELLPPWRGWPQVTTPLHPQHHNANAVRDVATCGCCTTAVRCSPSCTPAACKESSGLLSTCPPTVMSLRKPFLKVLWARIFKSPTLECSGSNRVSPEPLGNETFTRSIRRNTGAKNLVQSKSDLEPKAFGSTGNAQGPRDTKGGVPFRTFHAFTGPLFIKVQPFWGVWNPELQTLTCYTLLAKMSLSCNCSGSGECILSKTYKSLSY